MKKKYYCKVIQKIVALVGLCPKSAVTHGMVGYYGSRVNDLLLQIYLLLNQK